MGRAFDESGNVLGEAFGATKREVFEKLVAQFGDAAKEIRIKSIAQAEMPRYRCHKEVWALKIKDVIKHAHPDPNADDAAFEASDAFQGAHLIPVDTRYSPIAIDAAWYRKHNPTPGGYYVVYKDGYKSFSPAEAFEDGYTRI